MRPLPKKEVWYRSDIRAFLETAEEFSKLLLRAPDHPQSALDIGTEYCDDPLCKLMEDHNAQHLRHQINDLVEAFRAVVVQRYLEE